MKNKNNKNEIVIENIFLHQNLDVIKFFILNDKNTDLRKSIDDLHNADIADVIQNLDFDIRNKFISKVNNIISNLQEGDKIYIHCKGGHGRAGLLVSCLLSYRFKYSGEKSLELTNTYHNNRTKMNERWRKIGSPQTQYQKTFVIRLFKPIFLNNIHIKNTY